MRTRDTCAYLDGDSGLVRAIDGGTLLENGLDRLGREDDLLVASDARARLQFTAELGGERLFLSQQRFLTL